MNAREADKAAPSMPPETPSRSPWKPSIAVALTLGLSALMALVAGSVMAIGLMTAGTNTVSLVRQLSDLAIRTVEDRVNQHIATAENQARAVAGMIESRELDPDDSDAVLRALTSAMAVVPQTHGLALIRPERPILAVGIPKGETEPRRFELDIGAEAGARRLLADAKSGNLDGWRHIVYLKALDQPGLMVHAAIGEGEDFAGVVTSMVSIFELSSFLKSQKIRDGARAFVLYGRDQILAHPELTRDHAGIRPGQLLPRLETFGDPVLARIWAPPDEVFEQVFEDSETLGHRASVNGIDYVYLYREIFGSSESPWYVGVYMPSSETNSGYQRLINAGIAAGAIILISVVLVFLTGRKMARPIRQLAEASNAVTRLDLAESPPLPGSLFRELDSASRAHNSMTQGLRLFSTYVPRQLVLRLMRLGPETAGLVEREVSVMFTDIVGFTGIAGSMDAAGLAAFLNQSFALQAEAIEAEGGIIDKYIGDSIMAFWGAPEDQPDHAARALRGEPAVALRIGIHSGPAVAGNIGAPSRINYTLIGDTVNVAQRLEGLGREIDSDAAVTLVISADSAAGLPDNLRQDLELQSLGERELRGRAGLVEVLRVRRRRPAPDSPDAGQDN